MLESIRHARARTGADVRVVVTARDPVRLTQRLPWIDTAAWIEIVQGDVRTFELPKAVQGGDIDFAIHAANTASPAEMADDPWSVAKMVVDGSRRVRAIAASAGVKRMLQLSSGSVSGAHFTPAEPISEDDSGVPQGDRPAENLARAKREAEQALLAASSAGEPAVIFARGFALCGPWLPLGSAFAFGNFLGEAMRGDTIRVSGDGRPVRSYLYSGDMVVWLWTMLLKGVAGRAYNVGSERAVTIGELAHRMAALVGGTVEIAGTAAPGAPAHWHVPDTARARTELGLEETILLNDSIVRTAQWWGETGAPSRATRRIR